MNVNVNVNKKPTIDLASSTSGLCPFISRTMKIFSALFLGLCACDALRIDAGKSVSRRAAIGGAILPALFVAPAFAKYRPSLAEMKGFGSSPIVDEMKEAQPVKTELTHAQLVSNSCEMQVRACVPESAGFA